MVPLLILLTMMVMEGGLLFWNISYAQTAAAAGARTGVTQARENGYEITVAAAVAASIRNVTATPVSLTIFKADPTTGRPTGLTGTSNNFSLCTADCYVFSWSAATKAWVKNTGVSWPPSAQSACGPLDSTDYLGVQVRMLYVGPSKMVLQHKPIAADTMMRLEPVPVTAGQDCKP